MIIQGIEFSYTQEDPTFTKFARNMDLLESSTYAERICYRQYTWKKERISFLLSH